MKRINLIVSILAAMSIAACTDLEVEELDSVVVESASGEFSGVDAAATLASGYADLRGLGDQNNVFTLTEVPTDEMLVPTRGTDWGDNGVFRTLHSHTWDATHEQVRNTWNQLNSNVFKLNQLIDPRSNATAQQLAEGKFLRAWNMFLILDFWGVVPFRGVDDGVNVNPEVLSANEALTFIMTDLNEALPNLPTITPSGSHLTASKAAGNYLKAKVLLNKHVYLSTTPDAADMNQVIAAVDAISADGYALEDDYFGIFRPDADTETILITDASVGNRIYNGLHYNQQPSDNAGGGWNGFSATAELYNLFEGPGGSDNTPGSGQEERRGFVPTDGLGYGMLIGQQYDATGSGKALEDRSGNPLFFTRDFPGLVGNDENTGVRIIKYHPTDGSFRSHLILFRYADAHLMKAEAILRGGTSAQTPLQLVNELRVLREATPLASINESVLLEERGRELYQEMWRRNDQIRFGTFANTWQFKESTEEFRAKFPIPAQALSSNPNLIQNEGY